MGRVTVGVAVIVTLLALAAQVPASAEPPDAHHPSAETDHTAPKSDKPIESELELEAKDPLDHVLDSYEIELPESFDLHPIHLPHAEFDIVGHKVNLGLSKFMVLELIAAGLVCLFYIPLARRMGSGDLPSGWRENAREVLLTFIRDDVAKPAIGHDADKYVPFLWTMFLFILFNNLLGLIPFCGSATGNIYVTAGLALCVFFAIHGSGVAKMGFVHYLGSMWPHFHMGIPGFFLELFVFLIEWMGVLVRNLVLAVRLFANMFAGHVVLATILIFIYVAGNLNVGLWGTITVLSVLGQIALSLLELFVAFLQAYIFTFLTSLFLGMALHPEH
jgi:F-type H+-transporting ATPase subunit a